MRQYCTEASKYGDAPQPMYTRFKTILVIVNPMANKRSGLENVNCPYIIIRSDKLIFLFIFSMKNIVHRYYIYLEWL